MNPVIKKLQYKSQERVLLLNAPTDLNEIFQQFPVAVDDDAQSKQYPFVMVFVYQLADFDPWLENAMDAVEPDGLLWVCYPKKSSRRYQSDISRDCGWQPLAARDFEGVRQIAIDADWSALRFRHVDQIPVLKRKFAKSKKGRERTSGN